MKLVLDTWAGNQPGDLAQVVGVSGVILRGGQGNWGDADFASDWQRYRREKPEWKLGVYHVFDPYYTASAHIDRMMRYMPDDVDLPIVLDVELDRGKSNSEIRNRVSELYNALKSAYYDRVMIYTGGWWWNVHMTPSPAWQPSANFWLARYPLAKYPPITCTWEELIRYYPTGWVPALNGGGNAVMWQWSGDKFTLPGYNGKLDLNFVPDTIWESWVGEEEPPEPTLEERVTRLETEAREHGWEI